MIEFKRKYSVTNGNKITRKNWHKIVAEALNPCTHLKGFPEIDNAIKTNGYYYCRWKIKEEPEGFIFREVFSDTGICGHYPSIKELIHNSIRDHIKIYLKE